MASFWCLVVCVLFATILVSVNGETCQVAGHKEQMYTTTESTVSQQTVFIVEFTLQCKNKVKDLNLYAEMNGVTLPASRVLETNKYQVSFSGDHKKMAAGVYPVRIFDEEGYGDLKKAQRSGDDTKDVKSLFTINVNHQGASKGPWLSSVFVATGISTIVLYLAHSTKQNLERS